MGCVQTPALILPERRASLVKTGLAYCLPCARNVVTVVLVDEVASRRRAEITWRVAAGEKCPRCAGSIDAMRVVEVQA